MATATADDIGDRLVFRTYGASSEQLLPGRWRRWYPQLLFDCVFCKV